MSYVRFGTPSTFVTASASTDLWTAPSAHGLSANWPVFFYDTVDPTGSNIPSPLVNATTYYVISSGLTTTAFKVAFTAGGTAVNLTTNSGAGGIWLFFDAGAGGGSGPNFAPAMLVVPCRTGTGVSVNVIDAGSRGRGFAPQPFLQYLSGTSGSDEAGGVGGG